MKRKKIWSLFFLILMTFSIPSGARAQEQSASSVTLSAALIETYKNNPDLQAARAALKSVEELYPQAMAGFKPSVIGMAEYLSNHSKSDTGSLSDDPKTLSVEVEQPIYSGGSTIAEVAKAENTIKAERARLQAVEQEVLLAAINAYIGLLRDQEIFELYLSNEAVVERHLETAKIRLDLGDLTTTDVSLSEAELAKTTSARIRALGDLNNSRALFKKITGLPPPESLPTPELPAIMPRTEREALVQAEQNNPLITLAHYSTEAAKDSVRSVEGEALPKVGLILGLRKIFDPVLLPSESEQVQSIGIRATVPLYTGGSIRSKARQSQQIENKLRMQAYGTRREVNLRVTNAWEKLATSSAESEALKRRVVASRLALDGVQAETSHGSRTTLDLLDAQQSYMDAQVAYAIAETEKIISSYNLLFATGKLTEESLNLYISEIRPKTD